MSGLGFNGRILFRVCETLALRFFEYSESSAMRDVRILTLWTEWMGVELMELMEDGDVILCACINVE